MTAAPLAHPRPRIPDRDPVRAGRAWAIVPRALLGVTVLAMLVVSFTAPDAIRLVTMLLVGVTVLVVAAGRYGWRLTGVYVLVAFAVGTIFENISISTGFPFGHYHYPGDSPRIGGFPIMIGLLYALLGLICWLTASTLLDGADQRLADRGDAVRRINIVAMPVLSAALMAMYDLGSDSSASTIANTWVWERGGGIFGVPWTNYLGWWFVTYVFFQIFAIILASRPQLPAPKVVGREPLVIGSAAYFLIGAASLVGFATSSSGMVTDLGGQVWSEHALNETLFTINVFGTVVMAGLAAIKLGRNDLARSNR